MLKNFSAIFCIAALTFTLCAMSALAETQRAPENPFTDMDAAPWAREAVSVLYEKNIISGYNEKEYNPNSNVTRAEFTKLIMAMNSAASDEQKEEASKPIRIAAIGDSLTQGLVGDDGKYTTSTSYTEYLLEMLGDGYEIENFGLRAQGLYKKHQYYYGATKQYQAALESNPDVVVIFFGTNDAKTMYWDTIKEQYGEIYREFVREFEKLESAPQVIVTLPPPVFGNSQFAQDRPQSNMTELREIIAELADGESWKLVDSYGLFADAESLFPDGLHYNKEGAQMIASVFADAVKGLTAADEEKGTTPDIAPEATVQVSFDDVKDGDWFADYVKKAALSGIVKGNGSLFHPNDAITRQDAGVILYRLLGESATISESAGFTDEAQISDYAREAVTGLARAKIINGMSDGSFQPEGSLTRAQAAALIYSAYQALTIN